MLRLRHKKRFDLLAMKKLSTLFLLVIFAFASTARAQELIAEIPFQYAYNGWITVTATVNDEGPYDFIVDTGATISVVFENLNQQQNFEYVEGEMRRILGLIEANDLPPRFIGDIEVGGLTLGDLTSVVISDWTAPQETPQGVLGLDFFGQYAVQIDPVAQVIRLYSGGAPDEITSQRKWSGARIDPRYFGDSPRPLYVVKSEVRGRKYPFILDLGASGTVINYEAVRDMLSTRRVTVRSTRPTRIPEVQDLFGNKARSRLVRIQQMKIGRAKWRDKIVSVYDSDVFNELGVGEQPYGLFGVDMVNDRQVIVDFPNNRIHFGPVIKRRDTATN